MNTTGPMTLALPKGRILKEVMPILKTAGIIPEPAFDDPDSRQLSFATNHPGLNIIRVRSFDVATFVAFGAAHLGVAGNDVLMEFDYREIYSPLDLMIGHCRLSVAEPKELSLHDDPRKWSHVRVATKYPNATRRHFAARGVQAECIKLNGAMELAPMLGLCKRIVDLVSTGATLKANGLVEVETIAEITSRLIINRTAFKTRSEDVSYWLRKFEESVMAKRLDASAPGFAAALKEFLSARRQEAAAVGGVVRAILDDVRSRGDAAVLDYTARFDRLTMDAKDLAFSQSEITAARAACDSDTLAALEQAAVRIRDFHQRQRPTDLSYTDDAGVRLAIAGPPSTRRAYMCPVARPVTPAPF